VTNNHADIAKMAVYVHNALLLNNLSMVTACSSVQQFLDNNNNNKNQNHDNTWLNLLNEAISQKELLVHNLNQNVYNLNVLCEHVNRMISNQEDPASGFEVPMGVPVSQ